MNEKCLNALPLKQNKTKFLVRKFMIQISMTNRIQTRYLGFKMRKHLVHQPLTLDL